MVASGGKGKQRPSPEAEAKRAQASRHLGTILAAFEFSAGSRESFHLKVQGSGLKANKLSCARLDPYVRITRRLTTELSAEQAKTFIGGAWAPSRACVLRTCLLYTSPSPRD